jgi:putative hydrolase
MENVEAAAALGLTDIAITDHGPGHQFYGLDEAKIPEMRADIAAASEKFPQVKIWLGVEANTIDVPHGIDVPKDHIGLYDIIIAGYHYGTLHGHMAGNLISSRRLLPSGSTQSLRAKNTDMVVRALYSNDIYMLTHPGDKGPFDIGELCRACEATDTLMEISSRHTHLTVDEIRIAMDYDVSFIIDSDAHKPSQVGRYESGLARAVEAGLDLKRIVNITHR